MKSIFIFLLIPFLAIIPQKLSKTGMQELDIKIQEYVTESYKDSIFNGVVLVSINKEIISHSFWGYQNIANRLRNSSLTVYNLASITKPITATAIYILQSEGKLNIENRVNHYLPEFPYPGISIENLLTHTSGLPDYTHNRDLIIRIRNSGKKSLANDDIFNYFVIEAV